jgi:fructose/tagatose bisphosphate aldolase
VAAEASEVSEVEVSVEVELGVVGRERQRAEGVRTPLSRKRDISTGGEKIR